MTTMKDLRSNRNLDVVRNPVAHDVFLLTHSKAKDLTAATHSLLVRRWHDAVGSNMMTQQVTVT